MKDILPSYFSSEWSHSQFSLPDTRKICCFGKDNSVIGMSERKDPMSCTLIQLDSRSVRREIFTNVSLIWLSYFSYALPTK